MPPPTRRGGPSEKSAQPARAVQRAGSATGAPAGFTVSATGPRRYHARVVTVKTPEPSPASTAEYRRQARRLRCLHGDHPSRLQHALRDLARTHDRRAGEAPCRPKVERAWRSGNPDLADRVVGHRPRSGPPVAHDFAEEVQSVLTAGVLRYSDRRRLLQSAGRRGIGRFEANLIIAAVQHRAGAGVARATSGTSVAPGSLVQGASIPLIASCVVVVQTLIVCAAMWFTGM